MFGFLKSDPKKKLEQEYAKLTEAAMQAQRNGNIELYAELSQKAEEVGKRIDALVAESN